MVTKNTFKKERTAVFVSVYVSAFVYVCACVGVHTGILLWECLAVSEEYRAPMVPL